MCLVGLSSLQAQDSIALEVVYEGKVELGRLILSSDRTEFIDNLIDSLQHEHYLEAAIDSFVVKNGKGSAYLHKGIQYQDIFITPNATAIEYAAGRLKSKPYSYKDALKLKESLLEAADNNGYAFAEIKFDRILVEGSKVAAEMQLILNRKILIKDLKVIGDAKVKVNFLGPYLGLTPGKVLSKKQILRAQSKLDNLPFVSSEKKPNIVFNEDGAEVYIFAKEKQASRFDALIGVLPVNDPLLSQSVILTTTAMIDLINTLHRGERIFFEFRQLKPLTQNVKAELRYPYFAGLPFGFRSSFELSKQDTSFLDIDYTIGGQYLYGGDNFIELFFASDITRLLNVNEAAVINSRMLPARVDTRIQYYGLQWQHHTLDNLINPRQGWLFKSKVMLGVKEVRKSNLILDLNDPADEDYDFATLYDPFPEQDQFNLSFAVDKYFPIGKQSAIRVGLDAAGLFGKAVVFDNERFRIGGNQLLRGFNEQNFFTDRYLVNTVEYRFTLSGNSVLFAFSDIAVLQPDKLKEEYINPWGLGAGINFETAAGILSLSAAVGKDLSNSLDFFDLGKPKIHIGYVNLF